MGGEERGPPGGTVALLEFIEEHRPALTWDFRRYLQIPLSELGESISWGEAAHLLAELARETGSHLYADLVDFRFAASQADFASILLAETVMNTLRPADSEPTELPAPFLRRPEAEPVTPEEYARAATYLAQHSAFPE